MTTVLLFLSGLLLLLLGSRSLISNAHRITRFTKISPLIIGATLVAIGTSLPEITISLLGGLEKAPGIAIGDIIGSNIVNIGFIFGLSLLVHPLHVGRRKTQRNMIIMVVATLGLFSLLFTGQFSASWAGLFILLGIGVVGWEIYQGEKEKVSVAGLGAARGNFLVVILFSILSLAALLLGGKLLVDTGEQLAIMLHVPDTLIGITLVAIGTSLPELAVSLVALSHKATKEEEKLVVGNILGSNIFNILFGAGILGMFGVTGIALSFSLSAFIMFTLLFAILLYRFRGIRIPRVWGISLLLLYGIYLFFLLHQ